MAVSYTHLDNIGYIQITSFNAKTAEQFANAMTTMHSVGAKALIVDVRQNPGGVVSALKPILNQFVPSAIAATVEYSDGSRKTLIETDSTNSVELPIAVPVSYTHLVVGLGEELLHLVCIIGQAQEVSLLVGVDDVSAAVGTLAVHKLALGPEALAGGAVLALSLIHI